MTYRIRHSPKTLPITVTSSSYCLLSWWITKRRGHIFQAIWITSLGCFHEPSEHILDQCLDVLVTFLRNFKKWFSTFSLWAAFCHLQHSTDVFGSCAVFESHRKTFSFFLFCLVLEAFSANYSLSLCLCLIFYCSRLLGSQLNPRCHHYLFQTVTFLEPPCHCQVGKNSQYSK